MFYFSPLGTKHDVFNYDDQIIDIGIKMSRFGNVWSQIKQIQLIFNHLNSWSVMDRGSKTQGQVELNLK